MIKRLYSSSVTRLSNFLFFYEQNLLTTTIFSFLFLINLVFVGLPLFLIQLAMVQLPRLTWLVHQQMKILLMCI